MPNVNITTYSNYCEVCLIGAGGCARELAYQIFEYNYIHNRDSAKKIEIVGFYDISNKDFIVDGGKVDYLGNDEVLMNTNRNVLLTLGDIKRRRQFIEKFGNTENINFKSLILNNSVVPLKFLDSIGNIFSSNCFISTNVNIGKYNFFNIGVTVCHDCIIGNNVVISPNVSIAGNVFIGNDVFIGIGAIIKQGIKIGNNVTIGAGAVVVSDVKDGLTIAGVPAKELKK